MATRIPDDIRNARIAYMQQALNACFGGNKAEFGRALGFKDGSLVGQWERGERVIHESTLAAIADLHQVRAVNIPTPPEVLQLAHPMSLANAETVPSTTWEQVEMGTSQNVFRLPLETVEMEPRVKRGAWCQFARSLASDARPGDGVLVRDESGRLHFRVYKAGKPGAWEAHAANSNFEPLLSDRDGLEVIAVLTAVEGRWS